jgi:demethoxyubiquinone hydroxylase (CLK1/Coq7/Cat5 family)
LTEKERISTHRKNRGYLPLAEKIALLFPERNEKVITAHFHESTQRVINRDEQPIPEMTWTKNLYHLASNLDFYRLGLWETRLNNGALEVRYKNIDLGNLG